MSKVYFAGNKTRIPLPLVLSACFGMLVVAAFFLPARSRAKLETVQEAVKSKKARRPTFVPGEAIIRFRSESIAIHRTGALRLTHKDGQLITMKVENFEGSEMLPGLRVARNIDGDTLKAIAALREQPDVLYAEPNYILRAEVLPNDTHFVAGRQASMTTIGAPQAWNTTTGDTGVVVGVIDQGIDINHLDLQRKHLDESDAWSRGWRYHR